METKMRITLYDKSGALVSDRLVEQAIEFRTGPKSKHNGPIRLELNLLSKEDATNSVEYIQQLNGSLPIKTKAVRVRTGTVELEDKEPIEDLANQALTKHKTQEALINFLTEFDFKFIDSEVITDLVPELQEKLKLKDKHRKYQYMVRVVKEAKDPRNDKYDYRLLFGIKIIGKKFAKVQVYLFGKYNKTVRIPWAEEKKMNFKKVNKVMKFPAHMDYEDRKKWRLEHRKVENNDKHTQSKFYEKNLAFVKFI